MHILIVGGGIGGVTAAVALIRRGHKVTLIEQSDEIGEVGAGIQIWANGPRVLRRLGMGNINDSLACPMTSQNIFTQSGKLLTSAPIARIDEHCGEPSYFAHRGEFLAGLLSHANQAAILCGSRIESFSTTPESVDVLLTDGKRLSGDLLVGADGIHSTIRQQLGARTRIHYAGFVAWRGIAEYDESSWLEMSGQWGVYLGNGSQRGVFPICGRRAYWFMTENRKRPEIAEHNHKEYLEETISEWPSVLKSVLSRTSNVITGPIVDLQSFRGWSSDRVVLLGDASHAMVPCLGQGACMAIEDACVLANIVGRSRNLNNDLRHYESLRLQRTRKAMRTARLMARIMQAEGSFWRCLRQTGIRFCSPKDPIRAMKWLFDDCITVESI